MTRSELIIAISNKFPQLGPDDAELAVTTILDAMTQSLCCGSRIEIRGFGSFSVIYRPARTGRNPIDGCNVQVPGKYVPRFKVGKELRQLVKQELAGKTAQA